jgi:hypothetical protein
MCVCSQDTCVYFHWPPSVVIGNISLFVFTGLLILRHGKVEPVLTYPDQYNTIYSNQSSTNLFVYMKNRL